jgi:hypothetical protein
MSGYYISEMLDDIERVIAEAEENIGKHIENLEGDD